MNQVGYTRCEVWTYRNYRRWKMKRAGEEYLVNDYVISYEDVEELQDIVTLLQQEQPEVAARIQSVINNLVEI